jgi:hypothetical protein
VLIFFNSIIAYANTLILSEPKAPYGVGTVNVQLCDSTRTQLRNNKIFGIATLIYFLYNRNKSAHWNEAR